jgi:murein DD-endopeptidase MepM/ murein hydrolase activator NlpD
VRYPLNRMQIRRFSNGEFHPFHNAYGKALRYDSENKVWKCHQGWDLEARVGTPIYAICNGRIVEIGQHPDYGKFLTLAFVDSEGRVLKGKTYYATYAHLSACFPSACQHEIQVLEGTRIGLTGNSGRGARNLSVAEHHLHFEIRTTQSFCKTLLHHENPTRFLGITPYSGPVMDLPLRTA